MRSIILELELLSLQYWQWDLIFVETSIGFGIVKIAFGNYRHWPSLLRSSLKFIALLIRQMYFGCFWSIIYNNNWTNFCDQCFNSTNTPSAQLLNTWNARIFQSWTVGSPSLSESKLKVFDDFQTHTIFSYKTLWFKRHSKAKLIWLNLKNL